MEKLKFKTNINCDGCIAKVTPYLNQTKGIEKWEVDTTSPQKILIVETSTVKAKDIIGVLKNAGYSVEYLND